MRMWMSNLEAMYSKMIHDPARRVRLFPRAFVKFEELSNLVSFMLMWCPVNTLREVLSTQSLTVFKVYLNTEGVNTLHLRSGKLLKSYCLKKGLL